MRYLVDTDWLIDVLPGIGTAQATLQRVSGDGTAISIVTRGELFEGAVLASDPVAAKAHYTTFLAPFPALPVTASVMERFAEIRGQLRRSGTLIPDFDLVIAATALENGLVLVTRNRRHFGRIPDLQLYTE